MRRFYEIKSNKNNRIFNSKNISEELIMKA